MEKSESSSDRKKPVMSPDGVDGTHAAEKEACHAAGLNIVAMNADKSAGHGKVVQPLQKGVPDAVMKSKRWGVAHSADLLADNKTLVILADYDDMKKVLEKWPGGRDMIATIRYPLLPDVPESPGMTPAAWKNMPEPNSGHSIWIVRGAGFVEWARSRLDHLQCRGGPLELFYDGSKRLACFGAYVVDKSRPDVGTEWMYASEEAEKRGMIFEITKEQFRGLIDSRLLAEKTEESRDKELLAMRPVPPGNRHDYVGAAARMLNRKNGCMEEDDLIQVICEHVAEEGVMPEHAAFLPGGARHGEVVEAARYAISTYDPKKATGDTPNIMELSVQAMADHHIRSTPKNRILYWHDGRRMVECGNILECDMLHAYATDGLDEYGAAKIRKTCEKMALVKQPGVARPHDDIFDKRHDMQVLQNGVVDLRTGKFTEGDPDPDLMNTIVYPVTHDADATCPAILDALDKWTGGDERKIGWILDMFACALISKRVVQKGWILYGTGNNGKGACVRLLQKLIEGLHVPMTLKFMEGDNHWGDPLVGMLAVITGDGTDTEVRDATNLKMLLGGDVISVNPKGLKPYPYDPICAVILVHNDLPQVMDRSIGFIRKIQLIHFMHEFGENATFDESVLWTPQELAGLYNLLLPRMQRLINGGGIEDPSSVRETRDEWNMTDACREWIRETFEAGTLEDKEPRDALFAEYKSVVEAGMSAMEQTKLKQFTRKLGEEIAAMGGTVGRSGKNPVQYTGLKRRQQAAPAKGGLDADPPGEEAAGVGLNVGGM